MVQTGVQQRQRLMQTSNPSISVSSWFSVCSRSSLPPPTPVPRERPTASISSTKTMQGAFSFACNVNQATFEHH